MLDIERPDELIRYLRGNGRIGGDESPQIRVLAGGVSNRTVLVTRASGEEWVLKQALAKLRVRSDWFADPARIHREAMGMKWLSRLTAPGIIPQLIFEDESNHVLAMEAVPQPHENWKTMLLAGRVDLSHVGQFGALLGAIHRCSAESPDPLDEVFADRSYFESLRIEPYYEHTAAQVPEAAPFLHELIRETRARRLALVHGDFSPKNILIHNGRLHLIDHEVIHWGDPAFDIGFALTHLLSKAHHLSMHRDRFLKAASDFARTYQQVIGAEYWEGFGALAVRHTLGCLLARVAGRSPLEYLDAGERSRQRSIVISLVHEPPHTLEELFNWFAQRIEEYADD